MITTIYIPVWVRWCLVFGIIALGIDCAVNTVKNVLEVRSEYFIPRHDYTVTPLSQAQEELGELKALDESLAKEEEHAPSLSAVSSPRDAR